MRHLDMWFHWVDATAWWREEAQCIPVGDPRRELCMARAREALVKAREAREIEKL